MNIIKQNADTIHIREEELEKVRFNLQDILCVNKLTFFLCNFCFSYPIKFWLEKIAPRVRVKETLVAFAHLCHGAYFSD